MPSFPALLLILGSCSQAVSTDNSPYILLDIEVSAISRIASVSIPVETLRAVLGSQAGSNEQPRLAAFWEKPEQLTPLVSQSHVDEDGHVELLVQLPPGTRSGRVRLYAADLPSAAPTASEETVTARGERNTVIVNNGFVEVIHDPKAQGGLPSEVRFLHSGERLTEFLLNDRVYRRDLGQFSLRYDPDASVQLVRQGPLEVVVHVQARYMAEGHAPTSRPAADYTFRYRAGTPAIKVRVQTTQSEALDWDEHHLMEWNFPTRTFNQWTGGKGLETTRFDEDDQTAVTDTWGALTDGTNLVGLLSDPVRFYSGTPSYGAYVHGPWTSWSGTRHDVSCTLWLDSRADGLAPLRAHAEPSARPRPPRVTTPDIEALRERLESRTSTLDPGRLRSMHRWWLGLTGRLLLENGRLPEGDASYRQQMESLDTGEGVEDVIRRMRGTLHTGPLQHDERLAILWSAPSGGCVPLSVFLCREEREVLTGPAESIWRLDVEIGSHALETWTGGPDRFDCEVIESPDRTLIRWTRREVADPLRVELESSLVDGELALQLRATGESDTVSVLRATFPHLVLGPLGDDAGDDIFFRPTVSGRLVRAPLTHGIEFTGPYPSGWGSLPFMAYWDPHGGVYLGVHDPLASTKDLSARRSERPAGIRTQVQWPAPDATRPGNGFRHSGTVVLAAMEGDWYDATQIYRAWAEAEAQWWPARGHWGRPDTPDWFEEIGVWALASGGPDAVVDTVTEFAQFMGVPTAVHWYNWHQIPFDDDYPHYFPTKPGFAAGVARLQREGVRVMPYINGRLWDSDLDDFPTRALPAATKDRHGDYYIEEYGSGQKLVPMCPTQRVWQDTVHDIVLRLVGPENNVDGVYIDQVAAAAPRLCHDATHGHPLAGGHWWTVDGYWPLMRRIRDSLQDQFPDKMLTTECSADPYLDGFDGYLTWHYQDPDAVPAVAAVCGGKIQFFGRAIRGGDAQAHCMKVAQGLVYGEQLWWGPADIIWTQPVTAEFLRRCARLRHHLLPHLARGRLARPPVLHGDIPSVTADWAWSGQWLVTDSAVQAGAWLAEDGSVAYVFVNSTQEPLAFQWEFDAKQFTTETAGYAMTRVDESGHAETENTPARFVRDVRLGPLDAQAFVVRPRGETTP